MTNRPDRNVFGRIAALSILVAAGFYVARFCGPASCPLGQGPTKGCAVKAVR